MLLYTYSVINFAKALLYCCMLYAHNIEHGMYSGHVKHYIYNIHYGIIDTSILYISFSSSTLYFLLQFYSRALVIYWRIQDLSELGGGGGGGP